MEGTTEPGLDVPRGPPPAPFGPRRRPATSDAELRHREKVARIAADLHARAAGRPVSLRRKTVSHQVPKRNDLRRTDDKLDVSDLTEILSIDPVARTATAESGVTFCDLVRETLRFGLVPLVVPEHKTITLGGAVAGCSIESMSFRHGGFHDTCVEYELVTGTGEILRCTPANEHALLFQMIHGSFGTLGVLAKVTLRLVPARPFVHLVHERHGSVPAYLAAIERHAEDPSVDFLDGHLYGLGSMVLTVGRFASRAPYTSDYSWMKDYPTSMRTRSEDWLATFDYLYRYDRGVTQVSPSHPVTRALFGKLVHSDSLLRAAERFHRFLPEASPPVILDVFLPLSRAEGFLAWYDRAVGHWPLWCVPYRRVRDYEWVNPRFYEGLEDGLFLDLAVYGARQPPGRNLYKELEDALLVHGGIKTLISYNHYDEETFWRLWNRDAYRVAKARTDPKNLFRDLWVKTCRATQGVAG